MYWYYDSNNEPAIWNTATEGLVYTAVYASDGTTIVSYSITDYGGSDTEVVIPSTHAGLPVTAIGEKAFYENTTITSITIPLSVTSIGAYAFYGCTALAAVYFENDSKLLEIGDRAFGYCSSLTSIYIPTAVTSIGASAFYGCTSLAKVYYDGTASAWAQITFGSGSASPMYHGAALYLNGTLAVDIVIEGVTAMNDCAFYGCTSIVSVTFASGVKTIGEYAFMNCTSLEYIVLADSVTVIGYSAFEGCTALNAVYYMGTSTQFAAITVNSKNDNFTNAAVYYYSEAEPTESGNCWHYVNRSVPAVWS